MQCLEWVGSDVLSFEAGFHLLVQTFAQVIVANYVLYTGLKLTVIAVVGKAKLLGKTTLPKQRNMSISSNMLGLSFAVALSITTYTFREFVFHFILTLKRCKYSKLKSSKSLL